MHRQTEGHTDQRQKECSMTIGGRFRFTESDVRPNRLITVNLYMGAFYRTRQTRSACSSHVVQPADE